MNIYVGNLAWKTRQNELKELFENFGEVTNAFIVRDKVTRRSRGFGFVEMAEENDARQAIEKLNNTVFLDRTIIVNEALPKEDDGNAGDSDNASDEQKADTEAGTETDTKAAAAEESRDDAKTESEKAETTAESPADEPAGEAEEPTEEAEEPAEEPADEPVEEGEKPAKEEHEPAGEEAEDTDKKD